MSANANTNETRRTEPVVAIDGPAGSGKSTVSLALARRLGYALIDTGAIYRSVALVAHEKGVGWDDAAALADIAAGLDIGFRLDGDTNRVLVAGRDVTADIRTEQMSAGASAVSAHPAVRDALLGLQRRLGRDGGVVLEGRDIGTVIFPDAEAKFYLDADPRIRARRRTDQLRRQGQPADVRAVVEAMQERDRADSSREVAPLEPAEDAVRVDSTHLDAVQVVERMADHVERVRAALRSAPRRGG